jgi:very-short-patch-repair endonuclease
VEVDGDIHDLQKEEDERREKVLSEMGLRIVRFRNDDVVRDASRSTVVGKIREAISHQSTRKVALWRKSPNGVFKM